MNARHTYLNKRHRGVVDWQKQTEREREGSDWDVGTERPKMQLFGLRNCYLPTLSLQACQWEGWSSISVSVRHSKMKELREKKWKGGFYGSRECSWMPFREGGFCCNVQLGLCLNRQNAFSNDFLQSIHSLPDIKSYDTDLLLCLRQRKWRIWTYKVYDIYTYM